MKKNLVSWKKKALEAFKLSGILPEPNIIKKKKAECRKGRGFGGSSIDTAAPREGVPKTFFLAWHSRPPWQKENLFSGSVSAFALAFCDPSLLLAPYGNPTVETDSFLRLSLVRRFSLSLSLAFLRSVTAQPVFVGPEKCGPGRPGG